MNSGIYKITNSGNGKVYIGQSKNLSNRKYTHFRALEKGIHHNKHLQRSFDRFGADAFTFTVIERCAVEELDERERFWIQAYDAMNPAKGYNLESGGNAGKEVCEALRTAMTGPGNPMFGRSPSEETRDRMRISARGKTAILTESQVYRMKERIAAGVALTEIAEENGISVDAVQKIKTGKNWGYVHPDLNDRLASMTITAREERDRQIRSLASEGMSRRKIAERVGCTPATVTRVLGTPAVPFCASEEFERIKTEVVREYLAGTNREAIKQRYGLKDFTYVQMISEAYRKKTADLKAKAVEMRRAGEKVKDIAEHLGYARTTITKWTASVMPTP